VTLPVVWTPEANEDLLEARVWYDNIRPELGERFALAGEATIEAIAERPLQFACRLPEPSPRGSVALSVRHLLRDSAGSDHGNRLLPRQTQSETLAIAVRLILQISDPCSRDAHASRTLKTWESQAHLVGDFMIAATHSE
jgi:hypothetical protein